VVSKEPEAIRKPLELTIKITVGHKDPDALNKIINQAARRANQRGRLSRIYSALPHGVVEEDGVLIQS